MKQSLSEIGLNNTEPLLKRIIIKILEFKDDIPMKSIKILKRDKELLALKSQTHL